jgi:hypothetical protein
LSTPTLFEMVHDSEQAAADTETWARRCYEVVRYLLNLGHDELLVLSFIAERLEEGRRTHGDLDILRDPRDWAVELGEEAADALVYAAAMRIREIQTARPALSIVPREPLPTDASEAEREWREKWRLGAPELMPPESRAFPREFE